MQFWQAEAIRQIEADKPINDSQILANVLAQASTPEHRLIYRAQLLAQANGLNQAIHKWYSSAKIALLILWLLAIASGIGVAIGALNQAQVNLGSALLALLGLNTVTFIIWLIGLLPIAKPSSILASSWLWLNQHFNRRPKQQNAGQAFLALFVRHKLWPGTIGLISNSTWLLALSAATISLLVFLSTRNFSFHWETTILSPAVFAQVTQALGWLPSLLGFPSPDTVTVAASLNGQATANMQSAWSIWLIGCVITWGILPRLIALICCLIKLRYGIAKLSIDTNLNGWRQLKNRLNPSHINMGIDKPAPNATTKQQHLFKLASGNYAVLAYELNATTAWPPNKLPAGIKDLGNSSSRSDLEQVRKQLRLEPKLDLLFVCNSDLTPDRGAINWLTEVANNCANLTILINPGKHQSNWQQILQQNGFGTINSISAWHALTQV